MSPSSSNQARYSDHSSDDTAMPDARQSDEQTSEEIEKLRSILVKPEREGIQQLRTQLDQLSFRVSDEETRIADASEILAKATALSNKRDPDYSNALKPIVVEQFQTSSRENPEIMAEALFPILGPAIRKMIASMLSRDSKKTKRTYKFEQLFLIEKESGLPICHAKADSAETQDADMVSGMLSAIQSFVQDAFSTQEFDGLNTLQLGELSVWIEWGPDAVIAAVIRGVAPESCRTALQQLLEELHHEYATPLANYEGDASAFDNVKVDFVLFMDNHDSRLRNRVRNLPPILRRNLMIIGLATFALLIWAVSNHFDKRKWNNFVAQLDALPGIVVTDSIRTSGNYTVRGLKDPLAANPAALLAKVGLDPDKVTIDMEPYHAMHPDFTLQRIRSVLVPDSGTTLELDGSVLRISGASSKNWIEDAKRLSRKFPEITHVTIAPSGQ